MKHAQLWTWIVAVGGLAILGLAQAQTVDMPAQAPSALGSPTVFQAAGPTIASIQGTVEAYRTALGAPNNANAPGPLATGRREINWDGGGNVDVTTASVTPFTVFLDSRGGQFTTPGTGLSQAPPSAAPRMVWSGSSTIRPTPPCSAPSAPCVCSPQSAAT